MFLNHFKNILNTIRTIQSNQQILLANATAINTKIDDISTTLQQRVLPKIESGEQQGVLSKECLETNLGVIQKNITNVADRVEFVREEIIFELRVQSGIFKDKTDHDEIVTKIISSEKIDAGVRKVNIGCGHIQPDGYINIDAREIPGVDIISSASKLPIDDDFLNEIYCSHLIEHFTELEFTRVVLPHWFNKIARQGILHITVPDAKSMMVAYIDGEMSFDDLRKVTYGAQDYEGDFHYTMFTVESLSELLVQSGFARVELVEDNRKNGLCREMELIAYKH
jgi:predicted SAM-dependent methyltransferase